MNRLLRMPAVSAAYGLSRTTIYERISKGLFPPPVKLGPRCNAWPENEVAACNDAAIRGDDDTAVRALVKTLTQNRKRA